MRWMRWVMACVLVVAGCGPQTGTATLRGSDTDGAAARGGTGFPHVVTRRIGSLREGPLEGVWDHHASFSPDGRRLLFVDWESNGPGNLVTVDLETGERRQITHFDFEDFTSGNAKWMEGLFLPDGERVIYNRGSAGFELHVMNLDGTGSRRLLAGPAMAIMDLSPDGGALVMKRTFASDSSQLVVVSPSDASVDVVRSFDWSGFHNARISPDGEWLAYQRLSPENRGDWDVYVVAADGSRLTRVTDDGGRKDVLGWTASDGALLYATYAEDGFASVWRVPMFEGRPTGATQLVRKDLGGFWLRRVVGDALYYEVSTQDNYRIYEASVDLHGPPNTSPPTPVSAERPGTLSAWSWSSDGARIVYEQGGSGTTLNIRSLATGNERQVLPGLLRISDLMWAPDGRSVLMRGMRANGATGERLPAIQSGLYRYDLESDELSVVAEPSGLYGAKLTRDGTKLYGLRNPARGPLTVRDLETGKDTELPDTVPWTDPSDTIPWNVWTQGSVLSPQGDRIVWAVLDTVAGVGGLVVQRLGGGEPRLVFQSHPPDLTVNMRELHWTPDGSHLLFPTSEPDSTALPPDKRTNWGRQSIMAVPADGGPARRLFSVEMQRFMLGIDIHPDGGRVLFVGGGLNLDYVHELWVMENLSPPEERSGAGSSR